MIVWAYYGLKGWTYLWGEGRTNETVFKAIFCGFIVLGASVKLSAILDFADALIFVMAFPNLLGLYILGHPRSRRTLRPIGHVRPDQGPSRRPVQQARRCGMAPRSLAGTRLSVPAPRSLHGRS